MLPMPFEKGHKYSKGPRKKTKKHRSNIERFFEKQWDKSNRQLSLDVDEVNHRLYNDLPLDDLLDKIINKNKHTKKRKK